jgi:hypothetical protein
MIRKVKGFELMKNIFYNMFEHIWLKSDFDLEIMDFENVPLTKVVDVYVIKGISCIIYMIYNIVAIKMYLYLK